MSLPQNNNKINSFNKLNILAKFDSNTVSNVPSFTYLEAAKSIIDFKSLISDNISYQKAPNAIFQPADIIDFMVDASILGYSRFSHYENLREDAGYLMVKDFNVPSEKVCRDLLKAMPEESVNELRELNKNLLATIAKTQPAKEVILDFDDTVCTVFGNQEGSENGYNPRYKGRPSFKEKVGIISKTDELLNLTLEEGTHHSNHEFLSFLESCIETLPKTWYLKRIRADRGFFDQKNFRYCEDNGIEYVIKAKMQNGVKKIINYVNENPDQYPWVKIDNTFSVTEIRVPLKSWDRERRFVLIKKSLPKSNKNGQLLFEEFTYEYQAIVTNVDYLTAEEIFNDYNQRCNIENKIDELKEGFAFDQNTQINRKCNELYLLIKMIAFNLNNWFKRTFLPESMQHHEITTLRRIFYKIAGNICGSGWYKHIRFAPNKILQKTVKHLRKALTDFRKKVVLN